MIIREIREQRNITQSELAEALGVSKSVISKYETGRLEPSISRLQKIAEVLGVSVETLLRDKTDYISLASDDRYGALKKRMIKYMELFSPDKMVAAEDKHHLRDRLAALTGGRCELCGKPGPFIYEDGLPYLELHYIDWLSEGGEQTAENAVVLCPNCNRKICYTNDPEINSRLKQTAKKHAKLL